jgi:hypothetical protein
MRKVALLVVFFMLVLTGILLAYDCPKSATCSEHGMSGFRTGEVKPQPGGCVVAEYRHQGDMRVPAHSFWAACSCK